MSSFNISTLTLLILLFNSPLSYSEEPPETSPSPSPDIGADAPCPSPDQGADAPSPSSNNPITPSVSPSPSPSLNSPPAPTPDLAPESSPSSAPAPAPAPVSNSAEPLKKSPAPSPSEESNISRADSGDIEADDDSSEGMSGSKKAGISIGVVAGACIFGVGSLVYMKRQKNIRRAQYGYVARREIL